MPNITTPHLNLCSSSNKPSYSRRNKIKLLSFKAHCTYDRGYLQQLGSRICITYPSLYLCHSLNIFEQRQHAHNNPNLKNRLNVTIHSWLEHPTSQRSLITLPIPRETMCPHNKNKRASSIHTFESHDQIYFNDSHISKKIAHSHKEVTCMQLVPQTCP